MIILKGFATSLGRKSFTDPVNREGKPARKGNGFVWDLITLYGCGTFQCEVMDKKGKTVENIANYAIWGM